MSNLTVKEKKHRKLLKLCSYDDVQSKECIQIQKRNKWQTKIVPQELWVAKHFFSFKIFISISPVTNLLLFTIIPFATKLLICKHQYTYNKTITKISFLSEFRSLLFLSMSSISINHSNRSLLNNPTHIVCASNSTVMKPWIRFCPQQI